MKTLNFCSNPNTMKVAELVKATRTSLKKSDEHDKKQFNAKNVAESIGCSPTHYMRLEHGEVELTNIKLIYGIAVILKIPINHLIQLYLGLSDEEITRNFSINKKIFYGSDNAEVIKNARISLGEQQGCKTTQYDISNAIGCSKEHYNRLENETREFKDIRLLYGVAKALSIPLYILIRNELKISDKEMLDVISLPQNKELLRVESFIPKDDTTELRVNLIDIVVGLSYEELQIASKIISAIKS